MSLLHFALMIAVAIEAAVIVGLVVAFRKRVDAGRCDARHGPAGHGDAIQGKAMKFNPRRN